MKIDSSGSCEVNAIRHLLDDVFLLLRSEFISFFLSYLNNKNPNLHKKAKPWRILVEAVKWRHREYGLFMELGKKYERKLRTSRGYEPVTTRSNQLSYEITYVGSLSIMCSCSRERDECGKNNV